MRVIARPVIQVFAVCSCDVFQAVLINSPCLLNKLSLIRPLRENRVALPDKDRTAATTALKPFLPVCAVFSCGIWLPVVGSFHARTDVDACYCTHGHRKRVGTES